MKKQAAVVKQVLDNGLTVLVYPLRTIPKVSAQLWYNVGSKHEREGAKGISHFIEHMIFKGTTKLSESDLALVTSKLSGSCNAFTSQDYTGYLFDFPSQHWHEALPLFADCMGNCTFEQEFLDAELGAVVQELKMYRDDYEETLSEQMIAAIFSSHPYHHPIIGYRQDLFALKRETLLDFYKQYYVPNNATLVVVGDVDPLQVFAQVENAFGSIKPGEHVSEKMFLCSDDVASTSVTLHRDVQQPVVQFAFVIPGAREQQEYLGESFAWILCSGRGSRLHKKLVDELQIATDVEASIDDLFDCGLFFIKVRPKEQASCEAIEKIVCDELVDLGANGVTPIELQRAVRKARVAHLALFEDYQELAYEIGKNFLATGDPRYLVSYLDKFGDDLAVQLQRFVQRWFRPSIMHKGFILPFGQEEKQRWLKTQMQLDKQDEQALAGRERTSPVQEGRYVNIIEPQDPVPFAYPKPTTHTLSNGLEVLYYNNSAIGMIELVLELNAKYYYDPDNLQGLSVCMSRMLLEGTQNYSGAQLAQELESLGMAITVAPGVVSLSMLSQDFERGLELLEEILCRPAFEKKALDKVKKQMLSDLDVFWDRPNLFIIQHARKNVFRAHPFAKNKLGTVESIKCIQVDDIRAHHKNYVTPHGATMAVVGDLGDKDVGPIIQDKLGSWEGPAVKEIDFPSLVSLEKKQIDYPINRDQVVLCYAGLSVARTHPDYDKLLLFDQLFAGGAAGSMSSRLFLLREQTGWFYSIGGSLLAGATKQPGMVVIKTIVSKDKLEDAQQLIERAIEQGTRQIDKQEFVDAQQALVNGLKDHFESNGQTALAFLFLKRYGLPYDYFDTRAEQLLAIAVDAVIPAVASVLDTNKLITLRAGRL